MYRKLCYQHILVIPLYTFEKHIIPLCLLDNFSEIHFWKKLCRIFIKLNLEKFRGSGARTHYWLCAQRLLLEVLEDHMLEVRLRLIMCKASTLTSVLPLWLHTYNNLILIFREPAQYI